MRLPKKIKMIMGAGAGILFLVGMLQPQAANIQFLQEEDGMAQEQMGRVVQQAAWFQYNIGNAQEALGRHIQKGGFEGNISQAVLGRGITTTAHMRWAMMNVQESLGSAIAQVAQVAQRDATIGIGKIQEGLGEVFLADAQESFSASQEVLGRQIARRAELGFVGSVMANTLFAALQGEEIAPISQGVIDTLGRNGAYNQLSNFILAVNLLENETGKSLSFIIPDLVPPVVAGTVGYDARDRGWGGFAEYGAFAVSGFVFSMWVFGLTTMSLKPPMEAEEEEFEAYQKAA